MVTPKAETKTTSEEKSSSATFTAKSELVENFLENSSKLTNEQRVAFFEKALDGKKDVSLKTSAGTRSQILKDSDGAYVIFIYSNRNDTYSFKYDKNGKFEAMIRAHETKDSRGSISEVSDNLWAEKRGDSFIKDLQKAKKP